jgi:outer membrane lipoprotein carrier protein
LIATIFLVAAAAATPAALPSEARAVIERAAKAYSDGAAHTAAFVQTYTPAGFASARRESGSVWIQAPQRLRFDYTAPDKKIFTYDAGEGRFYSPEDKQLTVRKLTAEERARLPIVFLTDPDELAREYAITTEPGAADASRIRLTPRAARPELAWLTASAAPDGSIRELVYEDSAGNRTEIRFEAWKKEKARPAEDYRVTGPPGTRTVE